MLKTFYIAVAIDMSSMEKSVSQLFYFPIYDFLKKYNLCQVGGCFLYQCMHT